MKKTTLIILAISLLIFSACIGVEETTNPPQEENTQTETENSSENTSEEDTNEENTNEENISEEDTTSYTMAEVQKHNTKDNCWVVIDKKVYDLTKWAPVHPGGSNNITKLCGTDGTAAFTGKHGSNDKALSTLTKYFLHDLE